MLRKTTLLLFVLVLGIALVVSCGGPKERKAESVLDTPEYHYNQGKKLFEKGDLGEARREFNEAKSLKAKFAPAYEGLALVDIEEGNLESAKKNIDKSLSEDGAWLPAKVAKGKWYTKKGKYEDAIDEFEDVVDDVDKSKAKLDKKAVKMDALYNMGMTYKEMEEYIKAQTTLQKILDIDNTNVKASKAIQDLAKYQAAVAGQSPELKKIAKQKEITRADVAVLFVTELPLDKIFRSTTVKPQVGFKAPGGGIMGKKEEEKKGPEAVAEDVADNHWAKSFISEALQRGIIEKFPDGSFRPEEKVNRAEFARLIEHFLVKAWDDRSMETKFFGSPSPFSDVLNTSPIFNCIMTVSSRGIMPGFEDGTFGPLSAVPGMDALNIIRKLKAQF
jgi:tetratricopeptide (TPR) repeat protein